MVAHACDPALGRQRQEDRYKFKSARGMHQDPILKKKSQTNITINKNQKR